MTPGTQLGSYEILSPLGKGGMGEVWRARDSKLGREVAIKTLPEEFAKDEERLVRFEREAKLLASLNHPNIATIHGLEEHNDTRFLVLELVEGDTLADRVKRGAIPVEESLKLALQIAEALEAAHEKGVIHRDLKPGNIKVTPDGKVKVLDFGLAKAFAGEGADASLSQSPTLSMAATQQGVILGTAAYMSPEQARGQEVDKRTDVWAFGCVLFEMLVGRQLWEGPTATDMIAAAVAKEADFSSLPGNLHSRIQELLRRCLEKEPKSRWQAVGDVRVELEQALADPSGVTLQPTLPMMSQPLSQRLIPILITFMVTAIVAVAVTWMLRPVEIRPVGRFYHVLPEGESFTRTERRSMDISPDGTQIVYVANNQLYLRNLDEMQATSIPGTAENPDSPTFSPDGQSVAYNVGATAVLKKIAVSGGVPLTLCNAQNPYGMSWEEDDTIIFGQAKGIMKVAANGGEPEPLIETREEEQVQDPTLLPGGRWLLFTLATTSSGNRQAESQIVVQSLGSNERKVLIEDGSAARYAQTGHLLYAQGDVLLAVPFDLGSIEVSGGAVPLLQGVSRNLANGTAQFSLSDQGSLVYTVGNIERQSVLKIVDPNGRAETLDLPPGENPVVSPDGQRLALGVSDDSGTTAIWLYELFGERLIQPLTFGPYDATPVWSPDREWVAYSSGLGGGRTRSVYRKRADFSGDPEQLTRAAEGELHHPWSWSPDGRTLLYWVIPNPSLGREVRPRSIWALSLGDGTSEVLIDVAGSRQDTPRFSPDGKWIAYRSDASGADEIYLEDFPPTGRRHRIISGHHPAWSPDGKQLFFEIGRTQVGFVDIATAPSPTWGEAQTFPATTFPQGSRGFSRFDVMPDGEIIVLDQVDSTGTESQQINIIVNFFEELKERVPIP